MLRMPIAEELYKKFLAVCSCRGETLRQLPYEAFGLPDPDDEQPRPEGTASKPTIVQPVVVSCFNFDMFGR